MLTSLPSTFTHVLANLFFSFFTVKFLWLNSLHDPGSPGNEMCKAEQTALSKVCISAHQKGLLLPYIRVIMPPHRGWPKSHSYFFTAVWHHRILSISTHVHTFWHYHVSVFKFLLLLGYLFYSLSYLLYSTLHYLDMIFKLISFT